SGMSRPSTVRVAWRIEARMMPPESTTVPSRSKRTTGKRTRSIVAAPLLADVVVADADEVERVRRRGGAAARPRRAVEQLDEVVRVALEHRPDEGAHHVAQERVRGDLELDGVAALVPA